MILWSGGSWNRWQAVAELTSVGLDIGTTTSQMVVSRLSVENRASSFAVPEMEISNREILYRGEVRFTPLLHDTLVWGNICDHDYLSKKYYSVLDAFGYRDEALEFFRYQTQKLVLCREPDIHISVYRLRDKALAVIGNWQNKPRTVKVEIDRKALGLGEQLKFADLCTGKPVDPAAVPLQGFNFILMEIRQSK